MLTPGKEIELQVPPREVAGKMSYVCKTQYVSMYVRPPLVHVTNLVAPTWHLLTNVGDPQPRRQSNPLLLWFVATHGMTSDLDPDLELVRKLHLELNGSGRRTRGIAPKPAKRFKREGSRQASEGKCVRVAQHL